MALSKKTTVLFPEELYELLARLAKQRRVSVGRLVREACAEKYGFVSPDERLETVRSLEALSLPVAAPKTMKRQSVPEAKERP